MGLAEEGRDARGAAMGVMWRAAGVQVMCGNVCVVHRVLPKPVPRCALWGRSQGPTQTCEEPITCDPQPVTITLTPTPNPSWPTGHTLAQGVG